MHNENHIELTENEIKKIRGKWIVIEGPDRIGKTTLISNIIKILLKNGVNVMSTAFPRRNNLIGQLIDKTLKTNNAKVLSGKAQTMLFLADMLDTTNSISDFLKNDGVVITDRYVMSTYAYALAQYDDISEEWIKNAINLLPKPNMYVLLKPINMTLDFLTKRSDYGNENTEKKEIQEKVLQNMINLSENQERIINISVGEYTDPHTLCELLVLPRILDSL